MSDRETWWTKNSFFVKTVGGKHTFIPSPEAQTTVMYSGAWKIINASFRDDDKRLLCPGPAL